MLRSFHRLSPRLVPAPAHGFATNEKAVKLRMKAVDSIRKITKAMKMVASSKMRMDMQRLNAGKDFGFNFMQKIFQNDPFVLAKSAFPAPNKIMAIAVTTDRLSHQRPLRLHQLEPGPRAAHRGQQEPGQVPPHLHRR